MRIGCAQPARLAFAPVDMGPAAGNAWRAVGAGKIPQRAAAQRARPAPALREWRHVGGSATAPYWRGVVGRMPARNSTSDVVRYCPPPRPACPPAAVVDGHAAGTQPGMKGGEVKVFAQGSTPRPASSLRACGCSSLAAQTTAPKRRGSCSRRVPRSVSMSKWSCGPCCGRPLAKRRCPTCPGGSATARPSIQQQIPRAGAPPQRACPPFAAPPQGPQRSGLPNTSAAIVAPQSRRQNCACDSTRVAQVRLLAFKKSQTHGFHYGPIWSYYSFRFAASFLRPRQPHGRHRPRPRPTPARIRKKRTDDVNAAPHGRASFIELRPVR